jgi:hypothetical protein
LAKKKQVKSGKRRTREHIIADLSLHHLEGHVLRAGWTIERIVHDYGLDLLLFTYTKQGVIENGDVRFQLKATDRPHLVSQGQEISIRLDRSDLCTWLNESAPVILILYDGRADIAYWLYVQAHFQRLEGFSLETAAAHVSVRIPTTNVLDQGAVRRFREFRNRVAAQRKDIIHYED